MGSPPIPPCSGPPAGGGSDAHDDPLDLGAIRPPLWWPSLTADLGANPRARVVAAVLAAVVAVAVAWVALRPDPPRAEEVVPLAAPLTPQAVPAAVPPPAGQPGTNPSPGADATGTVERLVVHAAGAVRHPGVYELEPGARVADLVAAAGGGGDGADLDRLNLAEPLVDGSRVYVPLRGEDVSGGLVLAPAEPGDDLRGGAPLSAAEGGEPSPGAPLDLNRATASELESLPGVGPMIAAAIVEHRDTQGPFRSVDGLLEVPGIGEAKLAAVAELVTVGAP